MRANVVLSKLFNSLISWENYAHFKTAAVRLIFGFNIKNISTEKGIEMCFAGYGTVMIRYCLGSFTTYKNHYKVCHKITYQFLNDNGAAVEDLEWMDNFTPTLYRAFDYLSMLQKQWVQLLTSRYRVYLGIITQAQCQKVTWRCWLRRVIILQQVPDSSRRGRHALRLFWCRNELAWAFCQGCPPNLR